jgi:hypothetical protein
MRLARGRLGHHHERDLTWLETLHPLGPRENAALWRKNARDPDEIARSNAGGAKGELERRQLLAMLPDTLGEEQLLGNESNHAWALLRWDAAW